MPTLKVSRGEYEINSAAIQAALNPIVGALTFDDVTDASISTPAAGIRALYYSSTQNAMVAKDSAGVVHNLETGGVGFPLTPTIHDYGTIGGGTQDLNLSLSTGHVHKFTLNGNETLTFSNPPASGTQITFEVEVTQDATGGRTLTWPGTCAENPHIASGANKVTIFTVRTNDGGTTYHVMPSLRGSISLSGGLFANTTLSNLGTTAINADLIPSATATINVGSTTKFMATVYTGSLALGTAADTQTIIGSSSGIAYDVKTGDTHQFKVNASTKLQVSGSSTVTNQHFIPGTTASYDMGDTTTFFRDVYLQFIRFDATTQYITATAGGLQARVPTGDTIGFYVNDIEKIKLNSSGNLDIISNSIINISQLTFSDSHSIVSSGSVLDITAFTADDIRINTDSISVEFDGDANLLSVYALASASPSDGMTLELIRNDSTPSDGDTNGKINFSGRDNAANYTIFAQIEGISRDVSNTTEDGELWFYTMVAGTLTAQMVLSAGKLALNSSNLDMNGGDITDIDQIIGNGVSSYIDLNTGSGNINIDTATAAKSINLMANGSIKLFVSDTFINMALPIQIVDGNYIEFGTTTGTKIGSSITQKLSFYGVTPVVQAGAISSPSGGVVIDTQARAAIDSIRAALTGIGVTA